MTATKQWTQRHRLRYSNCWEDADILIQALGPIKDKRVCSIASAGDNALALLAEGPQELVCVDINPQQLHLVELKLCAIQHLEYTQLLSFLGTFGRGTLAERAQRLQIWKNLKQHLSEAAQLWWDEHIGLIKIGVLNSGRFESYFALFRRCIVPFVWGRRWQRLFTEQSLDERERYYREKLNTPQWKAIFKLFFSEKVMGATGREKAFFTYCQGSLPEMLQERVYHAFVEQESWKNPYLGRILTGGFSKGLPRYLQPQHVLRIQEHAQKLRLVKGTIGEALEAQPGIRIDAWNLSDIFEYMGPEAWLLERNRILSYSNIGAKLAYWNMMVPRIPPEDGKTQRDATREKALYTQDKAFFYSAFIVEEKI